MPLPGEFVLGSFAVPTLKAGAYHVQASQFIVQPSGPIPQSSITPYDGFVEVTAPRFALPPDQILSTFPPNRSSGAFSTRLPQIVLRRRTLPWERLAAPNQPPEMPWLALVVLADGEGTLKTGIPIKDCISAGITLPDRNDAVLGDALTVSNRVRDAVFPHLDEVALLAHIRRVDLTDTELALGDDDGDLAVLVANRLPQPGRSYTAYLISLENQIGTLGLSSAHQDDDKATQAPGPAPEQPFTTWPVLAYWSFSCVGEGDFRSLMQGLDVDLLGRLPKPAASSGGKPPAPGRPDLPVVEFSGHVNVAHTSRDGEPNLVLYRGPLRIGTEPRRKPGPDGVLPLLHSSDQARIVRSDGREDLSLATAFEIGRLLALAEPSVVAALLLWRKQALATARQAALVAADPLLKTLGTQDVGSGFAARAGLRVLTGLGADDARRLTGRAGPVQRPDGAAPDVQPEAQSTPAPDPYAALRLAVAQAADRRAERAHQSETAGDRR